MFGAGEAGDVFALLEGGGGAARDTADALLALYGAVREPWLTRALLLYHARTGSARALDLLARAPDAHARHLLDALLDQLRAERPARRHALAALAPLVARRPPWLHRLPQHPLARDLLRAAAREHEPLPLLHALLALAALLPAAPSLAAPHAAELVEALLRPGALDPPPPPAARAHLQLAQRALFHALYATHPCTLVEALRADLAAVPPAARDLWERRTAPLLTSVRLHPALVTGSRQQEADAARARWAKLEPHDVLAECRRLSLPATGGASDLPVDTPPAALDAPETTEAGDAPPGSGAHAARAAAALRPGTEPWFPLSERCGADSAPHTPLPAEPEPVEPPEAAVEATPENTPAREMRAAFRFPTDSNTVRAIGRSGGASPGGEAMTTRLARVASERRALHSPVPLGGAPPVGAQRPEPARPPPVAVPPDVGEDREVLELTLAAAAERAWPEVEGAPPRWRDPRASRPRPATTSSAGSRPPRRAASCGPRLPAVRSASVAVQTVDTWPEPYEFIIADFYRNFPDESLKKMDDEESGPPAAPCELLDLYLSELYSGRAPAAAHELSEQLALVHAQLMYERWRREAHAERNRRLLGRCRQVRALELHNAALREHVRAAQRERDELRARLARSPPPAPAPAPQAAPQPDLDTLLAAERSARLRAEAALLEAESARAADAAELHRARADSYEAARHVEALARAALAAERRAEHVRRLRRELLVLAEREARLNDAVRAAAANAAPAVDTGEIRALRAALARAEAEAEASVARAEHAAARAQDLETTLAARDAAVAELKRATRQAAEEGAARLRALQDKYAALLRVLRGAEVRKLEVLAGASGAGAGRAGSSRSPAGAAPALSACSRTRRLLEEEEALS